MRIEDDNKMHEIIKDIVDKDNGLGWTPRWVSLSICVRGIGCRDFTCKFHVRQEKADNSGEFMRIIVMNLILNGYCVEMRDVNRVRKTGYDEVHVTLVESF